MSAAQFGIAQLGHTTKKDKGPRAIGLVELSSDGNARLIPVAIMIDGKFYDASAYKASPVPLAIWGQTVYEAERTGVSQGLFTVNEAIRAGTSWSANGKWVPAGAKPAKKHTESKPRFEEDAGPPKLRRPETEKGSTSPTAGEDEKPASPAPTTASPTPTSPTNTTSSTPAPSSSSPPNADASKSAPEQQKPSDSAGGGGMTTSSNDEDPNRPVLARGKIETRGSTQHPPTGAGNSKTPSSKGSGAASTSAAGSGKDAAGKSADTKSSEKKSGPQLIPAVSDAGGPDPRPYSYDLKPDEEQKVRKKMLAMVSDLIVARAKPSSAPPAPAKTTTPGKTAAQPGGPRRTTKSPQPNIDDVQFHAFDLWNTNEPIYVMSVKGHMPSSPGAAPDSDFTYFITLVVKEDIYGDLRKLNATVTDNRHLDETPRMELIDAVDADGDGRGELLFREISDVGSVYGIYRAGADQLFPLFQGTH